MKHIKLTQGQVAIVDDEDYEWLNQWKWCASYNPKRSVYVAVRKFQAKNGKRKTLLMSRIILGLKVGDKRQADHINHDTLDNRRANLRICTHAENQHNQRAHRFHNGKPCLSQYHGVSWHKAAKKWHARIRNNGKRIYLGCFTSEIAAAQRYNKAATELFGEFACVNKLRG